MNTKNKYYAGIGSRSTPNNILDLQCKIATQLEKDGWLLSSGGAEGSDEAFERGLPTITPNRVILPWSGFNKKYTSDGYFDYYSAKREIKEQCEDLASAIHPYWDNLKQSYRTLHARNVMQILGENLDTPVKFVLYWAPEDKHGVAKGGTRTAVVLAQRLGIPTFNMLHTDVIERLERKYL